YAVGDGWHDQLRSRGGQRIEQLRPGRRRSWRASLGPRAWGGWKTARRQLYDPDRDDDRQQLEHAHRDWSGGERDAAHGERRIGRDGDDHRHVIAWGVHGEPRGRRHDDG